MSCPTVAAALPSFLDWASANLAPSTVYTYKLYLLRFRDFAGLVELDRLTPAQVLTWSQKFHPVQAVQRFASWCCNDARLISANPLHRIRLPRQGCRSRTLSRHELLRIMRHAGGPFRRFLFALRETIARPQEIRGVRWPEIRTAGNQPAELVDLVAGRAFFFVKKYKGKSRRKTPAAFRVIPIGPRLGRLLARLAAGGADLGGPVFTNSRGRSWSSNAVRLQVSRLRDRLGIVEDFAGERVVAYTVRHTQATAAVRAGVRDFTLAELMGHSSPRMTARYVHLSPEHLSQAIRQATRRPAK